MEEALAIPNEDLVYMRVHKVNLDFSKPNQLPSIRPVAFDPKGKGGLSVDWSAHSTAKDTLERAKDPKKNGVLSMSVLGLRKTPLPLEVLHKPSKSNFSHSEVFGIPPRKPTDMGIRVKLMDLSIWEINCS
ncbi:hypothetical protein [Zobellia roscoffensis]|uniref:hypothetical protein n=1 Tax=Zobellia roscoffensis TaxID=2779508 RepID=UPI00188C5250|nr:hypothetical protein [Zobellia roscoffensis]